MRVTVGDSGLCDVFWMLINSLVCWFYFRWWEHGPQFKMTSVHHWLKSCIQDNGLCHWQQLPERWDFIWCDRCWRDKMLVSQISSLWQLPSVIVLWLCPSPPPPPRSQLPSVIVLWLSLPPPRFSATVSDSLVTVPPPPPPPVLSYCQW